MSVSNSASWSGNIGEWGEAFVLLHLLAHNKLYNADSHGHKLEDEFGMVESISRTETSGAELEFVVGQEMIEILRNGETASEIPQDIFDEAAHSLFRELQEQKGNASHPQQQLLESLGCESLKASSRMKADLAARIYDGFISSRIKRDYSVKTLIGGLPSLANASSHSYIDYEISGFNEPLAAEINSIKGNGWVVSRVKKVLDYSNDTPKPVIRSRVFERNLRRCYWNAPEAVGMAFLYGQIHRGKPILESILDLEENNPFGYQRDELEDYENAIRRYLWGVVFDLDPGTLWKGPSQVDGYLVATDSEEVLAYQVSRQRSFENYLLLHTHWDTPSTSRYKDIGRVWQRKDGQWMFTLNCVVRYSQNEYAGRERDFNRIVS